MTLGKVKTRLGSLELIDGLPNKAMLEKVSDNMGLFRGIETSLNGIPATSIEGIRLSMVEMGADSSNKVVIFDKRMNSDPLFLTGNKYTVSLSGLLDLKKDRPTVCEIPPKCGPGTDNDALFLFVTDMGIPGPGKGAGGKFLILLPDYNGKLNPPVGGMESEFDVGRQVDAY